MMTPAQVDAAVEAQERLIGFWDVESSEELPPGRLTPDALRALLAPEAVVVLLGYVEHLRSSLLNLLTACDSADARGELAEEVNGELLDAARDVLCSFKATATLSASPSNPEKS